MYVNGNQILGVQMNGLVNVDNELSGNSENPVQNKAIANAVSNALFETVSNSHSMKLTDVSSISHNIYVKLSSADVNLYRSGKNFLPFPYSEGSKTANGITFIDNGDGSITITGQNNGTNNSVFYLVSGGSVVLPKGDYVVSGLTSGCVIMGTSPTAGYVAFADKRTLAEDTEFKSFYLQIEKGNTTVFDNVVVKPMIEMGTIATEYELYVEPSECVVNTDGTANVPSLYPTTVLYSNDDNVTITATYNKDLNKVISEIQTAISQLQGLTAATIPEIE